MRKPFSTRISQEPGAPIQAALINTPPQRFGVKVITALAKRPIAGMPQDTPTPTGLRPLRRAPRRNPVGVDPFRASLPRVARASQPWALRRNPVGILRWLATLAIAFVLLFAFVSPSHAQYN